MPRLGRSARGQDGHAVKVSCLERLPFASSFLYVFEPTSSSSRRTNGRGPDFSLDSPPFPRCAKRFVLSSRLLRTSIRRRHGCATITRHSAPRRAGPKRRARSYSARSHSSSSWRHGSGSTVPACLWPHPARSAISIPPWTLPSTAARSRS